MFAGRLTRSIGALLSNATLLSIASSLLDSKDVAGHPEWNVRAKTPMNKYFEVPWHQDTAYLEAGSESSRQITAWIPLVDVTNDIRGPVQVVRNGHTNETPISPFNHIYHGKFDQLNLDPLNEPPIELGPIDGGISLKLKKGYGIYPEGWNITFNALFNGVDVDTSITKILLEGFAASGIKGTTFSESLNLGKDTSVGKNKTREPDTPITITGRETLFDPSTNISIALNDALATGALNSTAAMYIVALSDSEKKGNYTVLTRAQLVYVPDNSTVPAVAGPAGAAAAAGATETGKNSSSTIQTSLFMVMIAVLGCLLL
eukprot:gene8935-10476_t